MTEKIEKSEADWQKELTAEQFYVCRHKGTERPFTGRCGMSTELANIFASPAATSCTTPIPNSILAPAGRVFGGESQRSRDEEDREYGMRRTEVVCARCGSHLGHVFDDGPKPTGLRYRMNSAALRFEPTSP